MAWRLELRTIKATRLTPLELLMVKPSKVNPTLTYLKEQMIFQSYDSRHLKTTAVLRKITPTLQTHKMRPTLPGAVLVIL